MAEWWIQLTLRMEWMRGKAPEESSLAISEVSCEIKRDRFCELMAFGLLDGNDIVCAKDWIGDSSYELIFTEEDDDELSNDAIAVFAS